MNYEAMLQDMIRRLRIIRVEADHLDRRCHFTAFDAPEETGSAVWACIARAQTELATASEMVARAAQEGDDTDVGRRE